MLKELSPKLRALLVRARTQAIKGDPDGAIDFLNDEIGQSKGDLEKVAIYLAIAEIYHLNYRDDLALDLFHEKLDAISGTQSDEVELAIAYNRSDITFALFQFDDFYGIVDQGKISDVGLWNPDAYHDIETARESQKRYESLPIGWRELIRAYQQGCWRPYRMASKYFARECMELTWQHEAVYHAIIAGDRDEAIRLGKILLSVSNNEMLEAACEKWLDCTHLKGMFVIGCEILTQFADAIPEQKFGAIFDRLLKHATTQTDNQQNQAVFCKAWQTIYHIAGRLCANQAAQLWDVGSSHPVWNTDVSMLEDNVVIVGRDDMMKALSRCVHVLSKTTIVESIKKSLPLAIEQKRHTDYPAAINLLSHLVYFADEKGKKLARERLFPSKKPLDAFLLQVAESFGVDLDQPESLSKDAENVAAQIKQQVRRLPLDAEVQQAPGTFGFYTVEKQDHKLVINMADTIYEVAVLRHRQKINEKSLNTLVDAMIAMITERENLMSNRISLVQSIEKIGDCCTPACARKIYDAVAPIAMGRIDESESLMSAAESANPLNPNKMNVGTPSDLRAVSVFLLCCIERDQPGVYGKKLNRIVAAAITDPNSNVRSHAIAGAREKTNLSESELTAIILATRDYNVDVVSTAFGALANKEDLGLKRPQWRLLIHSIEIAKRSPFVKVRRSAAFACSNLISRCTTSSFKKQMDELLAAFKNDHCWSVRANAKESKEEKVGAN